MTKGNGKADTPTPIAAETMRGDLRDNVLEVLKRQTKPWQKMSETEQKTEINRVDHFCDDIIEKAVPLIRAAGHAFIVARVDKVVIDDKGAKLQFGGVPTTDNAMIDVAHLQGKRVVITEAAAGAFLGERAPARAEPDQGTLLKAGDGSPFKVEPAGTGKVKTPSAVAAEIGEKLMQSEFFTVARPVLESLAKEMVRDPSRIAAKDESGIPTFSVRLGDEALFFARHAAGSWFIASHVAGDKTLANENMSAKGVSAFIRAWVAEGQRKPQAKPTAPVEPATAGDKPGPVP